MTTVKRVGLVSIGLSAVAGGAESVAFWSFLILGLLLAPVLQGNNLARVLIPAGTSLALTSIVWWIRRNRARSS